ncbi:retrotransposon protein putative unclassified, partial [Trifolium medium]|nr:retrotransposon protein putative unclassified [Trifolium medium]
RFGIVPKRIKELQSELEGLNHQNNMTNLTQQITYKERELDELLECEEMWWSQRIKDSQGNFQTEHDQIESIFLTYFQDLFQSQQTYNVRETVEVVKDKITPAMAEYLSMDFREDDVIQAIKDMKGLAAPGPDGLSALFYHNYWDIVGKDVIKEALNVLNSEGDPKPLNHTNICLIPKTNNPNSPSDFRPISLCNVTLKIITKTIANRIKAILPETISQNQSAFIPGRLITDNTLIASEIFHYFHQTSRKKGYVGFKTDMAKAYDRVEWDFLRATLESMGFPLKMINTILKCVSTVSFSILINGVPSNPFSPQRGLRQGDPLSPYLFIICANVFSELISKAQSQNLIHGAKISNGAPEISHLLYADDSLLFCRANKEEVSVMQNIIDKYQRASGQLVNIHKSEMIFSKGVPENIKGDLHQIMP